jgi:hypothetical protein
VNFKSVVNWTFDFVRREFDSLLEGIRTELESKPLKELQRLPVPEHKVPTVADVSEILSATLNSGVSEIECAGGVLEVISPDGAVRLDSGRSVTLQELIDVADGYWKEWSERAAKARQK